MDLKRLYKKIDTTNKHILSTLTNSLRSNCVFYISEPSDWVIKDIGNDISAESQNIKIVNTYSDKLIRNSIVHYGSANMCFNRAENLKQIKKNNKIVATYYHVVPENYKLELIKRADELIDIWHTSCEITKKQLLEFGINERKIVTIPIGVNLNKFKPTEPKTREELRKELNIPEGHIAIGSFQKDGNGWGEGLEPKFIKGPDIFCDVVEKLSNDHPLFIVLTGPARGYVKNRLEKAKIPYIHEYTKKAEHINKFYSVIDLYLSTSRIEGGPKSIVESFATNVPIASTRVGMAPDLIQDGVNGILFDSFDVDDLCSKLKPIILESKLRKALTANGLGTVKNLGFDTLADRFFNEIYSKLRD